jgi:DNA mismatch endonuclease (patch repair protein)
MSKSKDTKPEVLIQDQLSRWEIEYESHARDLPGTPDLVFRRECVAVFIHGCFWHQHGECAISRNVERLNEKWQAKFAKSGLYDLMIMAKLKAEGWRVLILWECDIYNNVYEQAEKIVRAKYLNFTTFEIAAK